MAAVPSHTKCPFCRDILECHISFKAHLQTCPKLKQYPLLMRTQYCTFCLKKHGDAYRLCRHISTYHSKERHVDVVANKMAAVEKPDTVEIFPFLCSGCSRGFAKAEYIAYHLMNAAATPLSRCATANMTVFHLPKLRRARCHADDDVRLNRYDFLAAVCCPYCHGQSVPFPDAYSLSAHISDNHSNQRNLWRRMIEIFDNKELKLYFVPFRCSTCKCRFEKMEELAVHWEEGLLSCNPCYGYLEFWMDVTIDCAKFSVFEDEYKLITSSAHNYSSTDSDHSMDDIDVTGTSFEETKETEDTVAGQAVNRVDNCVNTMTPSNRYVETDSSTVVDTRTISYSQSEDDTNTDASSDHESIVDVVTRTDDGTDDVNDDVIEVVDEEELRARKRPKGPKILKAKCLVCLKDFCGTDSLNEHYAKMHGIDKSRSAAEDRSVLVRRVPRVVEQFPPWIDVATGSRIFPCDGCPFKASTREELDAHKRPHPPSPPKRKAKPKIAQAEYSTCVYCTKTFFTREQMERHIAAIHEIPCAWCNQKRTSLQDLMKHEETCSAEMGAVTPLERFYFVREKTFARRARCTYCEVTFDSHYLLSSHINTLHLDILCEVRAHWKICSEYLPFRCSKCQVGFEDIRGLMNHWNIRDELKIPCRGNRFLYSFEPATTDLTALSNVTDVVCQYCGLVVANLDKLMTHRKKKHSLEFYANAPYHCKNCYMAGFYKFATFLQHSENCNSSAPLIPAMLNYAINRIDLKLVDPEIKIAFVKKMLSLKPVRTPQRYQTLAAFYRSQHCPYCLSDSRVMNCKSMIHLADHCRAAHEPWQYLRFHCVGCGIAYSNPDALRQHLLEKFEQDSMECFDTAAVRFPPEDDTLRAALFSPPELPCTSAEAEAAFVGAAKSRKRKAMKEAVEDPL